MFIMEDNSYSAARLLLTITTREIKIMTFRRILLPVAFVTAATLTGCNDSEQPVDAVACENVAPVEASVTIIDVQPATATAGVPTEFTVDVEYSLSAECDGVLDIGFNDGDSVTSFYLHSPLEQVVAPGTGTATFTVADVTPVDWSPENFQVTVYLSEYPTPSSWTPYASGAAVIAVTADVGAATAPAAVSGVSVTSAPVTCYEGGELYCVNFQPTR